MAYKLEFDLDKHIKTASRKLADGIKKTVIDKIVKSVRSGNSPVSGMGRYKKYSDSYMEQIKGGRYRQFGKKTRPVNLTLSGKMLKSFRVKALKKGGVSIWLTDYKGKFHNTPGIARVLRPILPTGRQVFIRPIQNEINDILEKSLKRSFKK